MASHKLAIATEGLQRCKARLMSWSKVTFGNFKRTINSTLSQLPRLQELNKCEIGDKIKVLKGEVNLLLEEEDVKWKQRAKQRWLKDGDTIHKVLDD